jgi:hypothetical protein
MVTKKFSFLRVSQLNILWICQRKTIKIILYFLNHGCPAFFLFWQRSTTISFGFFEGRSFKNLNNCGTSLPKLLCNYIVMYIIYKYNSWQFKKVMRAAGYKPISSTTALIQTPWKCLNKPDGSAATELLSVCLVCLQKVMAHDKVDYSHVHE